VDLTRLDPGAPVLYLIRGDSEGRREAGQKIFMRDDQCTERDTTERVKPSVYYGTDNHVFDTRIDCLSLPGIVRLGPSYVVTRLMIVGSESGRVNLELKL